MTVLENPPSQNSSHGSAEKLRHKEVKVKFKSK